MLAALDSKIRNKVHSSMCLVSSFQLCCDISLLMLYIFTDLHTNMLMYHQTGFLLDNVVLENEVIDLGAFGLNEKCWIFIFFPSKWISQQNNASCQNILAGKTCLVYSFVKCRKRIRACEGDHNPNSPAHCLLLTLAFQVLTVPIVSDCRKITFPVP